jgi:selenocysteine lyase/cysteine desulfurase
MDYLDHPATSRPKAPGVPERMAWALTEVCASPGRSGHRLGALADKCLEKVREKVARHFSLPTPEAVVFTPGGTWSLNLALKGILRPGDHVVATAWEHNSVLRPLARLEDSGCEVSIVREPTIGDSWMAAMAREIRHDTRLVVVNHASNVCGSILPVERLAPIAHAHGALLLVDASQTVGHFRFDPDELQVDLLAFGGHKGLLGPPGVGCLLVLNQDIEIGTLVEGGTGRDSANSRPPLIRPWNLESGTSNLPAIAGLGAALDFLETEEFQRACERLGSMRTKCLERLEEMPFITIYHHPGSDSVPIVTFNIDYLHPARVSQILDEEYGILTRSGLHCAPLAHEMLESGNLGSVRAGFGYGNDHGSVDRLCQALDQMSSQRKSHG